jgi:hypothetical protein
MLFNTQRLRLYFGLFFVTMAERHDPDMAQAAQGFNVRRPNKSDPNNSDIHILHIDTSPSDSPSALPTAEGSTA